jgi:hypothetical protein
MSAEMRTLLLRQSRPMPMAVSFIFSLSTPVPPSRCTAFRRMPVAWSGPKRRAMSVETEAWPPDLQAQADAAQRLVGRALGQQVDAAAYAAAAGRRAIEETVGAAEDFHAFEEFGGDVLARQHAVQAVVGHVIRVHGEAAHHVELLEVAETARRAHRRVVQQHIGDAFGLLVLDQFVGVAGAGKRRFHDVLVAQDADAPAARHLAAGKGFGQAFGRSVGAGVDGHRGQCGRGRVSFRRRGILRMAERQPERQSGGGCDRGEKKTR